MVSTIREVTFRFFLQGSVVLLLLYYLAFCPPGNGSRDPSYSTYFVALSGLAILVSLQYSQWYKDISYIIRRWKIKTILLNIKKKESQNCFNQTSTKETLSPTDIGFIPSDEQILIENPYISSEKTDNHSAPDNQIKSPAESLTFKCGSDTGSWLVVNYERDPVRKLGLPWLVWHHKPCSSKQGYTYINITNKNKYDDALYSMDHSDHDTFKTNGLSITILEPFRRWRIVFNGMMRNIRNGSVHHVRMNLIWSSLSSPYDWKSCHPIDQVVDSLSHNDYLCQFLENEDDKWMFEKVIDLIYPEAYHQWGAAFGKVLIDMSDNYELVPDEKRDKDIEIDLYYRGLRERTSIGLMATKIEKKAKMNTRMMEEFKVFNFYFKNEISISLTGITENGFHFVVYQFSLIPEFEKTTQKHRNELTCSFGHMMIPGKDIVPITEIEWPDKFSLLLSSKESQNSFNYSDSFFVRFFAGGRWFNVCVERLCDRYLYNIVRPSMLKNEQSIKNMQSRIGFADIAPNCGRGRAIIEISNSNDDDTLKNNYNGSKIYQNGSSLTVNPICHDTYKSIDTSLPLVIPIKSKECMNESVSGGKGSSLSVLMNANESGMLNIENVQKEVKIPDGVVVTSSAFKFQIESTTSMGQSSFRKLIKQVETNAIEFSVAHANFLTTNSLDHVLNEESTLSNKNNKREALEEACNKLEKAFYSQDICKEIKSEFRNALNEVFKSQNGINGKRFAVRSSALGEDSDELSAAGQNETFLGVEGTEDHLLAAIRKCWASLFTIQSVEYRRQNGQPVSVDMAVVIQEMVPAKAAGVMFSVHPFTGSPAEVIITTNYGLGESIVSAMSEPDTIKVSNKFWNESDSNQYSVEYVKLGSKSSKVIMVSDEENSECGGTKIESMENDPDSLKCCLETETSILLSKVATKIQTVFRDSPRDCPIEVVDSI